MKKAFITGISGFAGRHLAKHLLAHGSYQISGTYNSENSLQTLTDIREDLRLFQVDLKNKDHISDIIKEQKPDFVFHLAALASPAESFKDPLFTITSNVAMQINLLEAIKKNELFHTKILIVSSADVYGVVDPKDLPIDEETGFHPTNPYAVSKLTQDFLGLQYATSHDLEIIRVRPFNHIGDGQSPQFVVSAFAMQIAEIEKGKKEPVIYVGNIETKRDFTDVRDIVTAYQMILEKGVIGEVYNIGSGTSYKISDILDNLLALTTKKITIKIEESRLRPSDTPELVCDNNRLREMTGWKPRYTIDDTLKNILDYWRKIV